LHCYCKVSFFGLLLGKQDQHALWCACWPYLKYSVHICSNPLTHLTFPFERWKHHIYGIKCLHLLCARLPSDGQGFFSLLCVLVMVYHCGLMWSSYWYRMMLLQLCIMMVCLPLLDQIFFINCLAVYVDRKKSARCYENPLLTHLAFVVLQVKLRLQTYYQNIESLLSTYEDIIVKVGTISFNWKLSAPSVLSRLMCISARCFR